MLAVLVLASMAAPPAVSATAGGPESACDPTIILLPGADPTMNATVAALSDAGLVVGTAWRSDMPADAVVWRDIGPPTELGIGGILRDDGSRVDARAVDVNEQGVVAAVRTGYSPYRRFGSQAAVLWEEYSGATRLPALPQRRWAHVAALNDHGVAVGAAYGPKKQQVPVLWAAGQVTRLPLPRRATSGYAVDNNNHGLIVGNVMFGRETRPWWWRRSGRNGPLSVHGLRTVPVAAAVDDHGRVVGDRRRLGDDPSTKAILWRTRSARPRQILGRMGGVTAMDASRNLVGHGGGFRGIGTRAWVARLHDASVTMLPPPPTDDPADGWANTYARGLSTAVTPFAPQGGRTIGGSAEAWDDGPTRGVLWTCSQTYLR